MLSIEEQKQILINNDQLSYYMNKLGCSENEVIAFLFEGKEN